MMGDSPALQCLPHWRHQQSPPLETQLLCWHWVWRPPGGAPSLRLHSRAASPVSRTPWKNKRKWRLQLWNWNCQTNSTSGLQKASAEYMPPSELITLIMFSFVRSFYSQSHSKNQNSQTNLTCGHAHAHTRTCTHTVSYTQSVGQL